MSKKNISLSMALIMALLIGACGGGSDEGPETPTDSFDRAAMLANWADNIIIPAYNGYMTRLDELRSTMQAFFAAPDATSFDNFKTAWASAYTSWQNVSMFEIGPAETLTLRNFTNTYPTDPSEIEELLAGGDFNLNLPSTNDAQGFPALEYLLVGLDGNGMTISERLNTDPYKTYVTALVNRLWDMGNEVRLGWTETGFRDDFVSNSGSSATASVNKMVNDFMFYYEKSLRAGKVGIPAGVFSGTPLSDRVEAPFSTDLNRQFLTEAIGAVQSFFTSGVSLDDYLDQLEVEKDGERLSVLINNQLNTALQTAEALNENLRTVVETDNSRMLGMYDELQKLVVLLKVDMFQALNIQVDFVDADGD